MIIFYLYFILIYILCIVFDTAKGINSNEVDVNFITGNIDVDYDQGE